MSTYACRCDGELACFSSAGEPHQQCAYCRLVCFEDSATTKMANLETRLARVEKQLQLYDPETT